MEYLAMWPAANYDGRLSFALSGAVTYHSCVDAKHCALDQGELLVDQEVPFTERGEPLEVP